MKMNFYPLFLSLIFYKTYGRSTDYWSGSFDPKKNCLEEELMKNLTKESFPRCAAVVEGKKIVIELKTGKTNKYLKR